MSAQRITITLPRELADRLRKEARDTRKPVSRLVAEAVASREQHEVEQRMIRGYKEAAALNRRLAEEALPAIGEILPPD